jgi:tRNA(Ile2) C34 agmatinyltransferase TiaS
MTTAYIGLDDTDNLESRGTGHLARAIADQIALRYPVVGVSRHQLFFDPRVPYTSHNSSAAIIFEVDDAADLAAIFSQVREIMLADFQPGSDPGLCLATQVPKAVTRFGQKAKVDLVTQAEARALAAQHHIQMEGLGGTQDGVIGALSAVGLSAAGSDGRYVRVGSLRSLAGWQPVETILASGVDRIQTMAGEVVETGLVLADKLRPARLAGQVVLVVEAHPDGWMPLKLD